MNTESTPEQAKFPFRLFLAREFYRAAREDLRFDFSDLIILVRNLPDHEDTSFVGVNIEGHNSGRVRAALEVLEEIAKSTRGAIDTLQSKPLHRNPLYTTFKDMHLDISAPQWISEMVYKFE